MAFFHFSGISEIPWPNSNLSLEVLESFSNANPIKVAQRYNFLSKYVYFE